MNGKVGRLLLGPVLCAGFFPAALVSAQTRTAAPARTPARAAQVRPAQAAPQARPAAAPRRPNDHLGDEAAKIRRGIQSGELNRQEVARLKNALQTLQNHEKRALQDGTLSPQEKEKLHDEMAKLDRAIYLLTHDNDEHQ